MKHPVAMIVVGLVLVSTVRAQYGADTGDLRITGTFDGAVAPGAVRVLQSGGSFSLTLDIAAGGAPWGPNDAFAVLFDVPPSAVGCIRTTPTGCMTEYLPSIYVPILPNLTDNALFFYPGSQFPGIAAMSLDPLNVPTSLPHTYNLTLPPLASNPWIGFQGFLFRANSQLEITEAVVATFARDEPSVLPSIIDPVANNCGSFGYHTELANLDGDGADEILIGSAIGASSWQRGRVDIYDSTSAVPSNAVNPPLPTTPFETLLPPSSAPVGQYFGSCMAVGNIDSNPADQEIVVGARGFWTGDNTTCFGLGSNVPGAVYTFKGSLGSYALSPYPTITAPAPTQNDSWFGHWVEIGDFDGNGIGDIAIGEPRWDDAGTVKDGRVTIVYGPIDASPGTQVIVNPNAQAVSTPTEGRFGYRLVAGDFDGDGLDDLSVAHTYEGVTSSTDRFGAISFWWGGSQLSPTAAPTMPGLYVPNPTPNPGELMGADMVAADIFPDAANTPELVVGTEFDDDPATTGVSGDGSVQILDVRQMLLNPGQPTSSYITTLHAPIPSATSLEGFGSGVAAGDYNGDMHVDLFVGQFFHPTGGVYRAGRAFMLYGPDFVQYQVFDNPNPGSSDGFGRRMAGGDVDGDGRAEMLIGTPFDAPGEVTIVNN